MHQRAAGTNQHARTELGTGCELGCRQRGIPDVDRTTPMEYLVCGIALLAILVPAVVVAAVVGVVGWRMFRRA